MPFTKPISIRTDAAAIQLQAYTPIGNSNSVRICSKGLTRLAIDCPKPLNKNTPMVELGILIGLINGNAANYKAGLISLERFSQVSIAYSEELEKILPSVRSGKWVA